MALKDAYALGCYVSRHMGTAAADDRATLAMSMTGREFDAYMLGRDRSWRLGF